MTLIEYSQFSQFIFFFLAGIIASLILITCHQIISNIFRNRIVYIILDIAIILLFTCYYIYLVNVVTFGEIRFYTIIAFLLGIALELVSFRKLFGVLLKKVYTIFRNLGNKLKDKKFIKFISK